MWILHILFHHSKCLHRHLILTHSGCWLPTSLPMGRIFGLYFYCKEILIPVPIIVMANENHENLASFLTHPKPLHISVAIQSLFSNHCHPPLPVNPSILFQHVSLTTEMFWTWNPWKEVESCVFGNCKSETAKNSRLSTESVSNQIKVFFYC